jgi:hypothetical protein
MITMRVSSVPAAPSSFCSTAQISATVTMISDRMGHTSQNELVGYPCNQGPAIRAMTRPAAIAYPARTTPRQRPEAVPVALLRADAAT